MAKFSYAYFWNDADPALPFIGCKLTNELAKLEKNSTLRPNPVFQKGTVPCWNGEEWIVKLDWRCIDLYDKSTGELYRSPTVDVNVAEIELKYTTIPPSDKFSHWVVDKWVIDAEAKTKDDVAKLTLTRKTILDEATNTINQLEDIILYKESISDSNTEAYKDALNKWRLYRGQVSYLKIITGEETFPIKPISLENING